MREKGGLKDRLYFRERLPRLRVAKQLEGERQAEKIGRNLVYRLVPFSQENPVFTALLITRPGVAARGLLRFMAHYEAFLTGIHSRPEILIKKIRDYERGRIGREDLEIAFKTESEKVIQLQLQNGITSLTDGMLKWDNLIAPFAHNVSGLRDGGLIRWFDNNTFYRKPVVTDRLQTSGPILENLVYHELLKGKPSRVVVPDPYTFATICEDRFYGSTERLMLDFSQILNGELKKLEKLGISEVQLSSPSLVTAKSARTDFEVARGAIEQAVENLGMRVCLQTFFGNAKPLLPQALELPIDSLGIDFSETDPKGIEDYDFDIEISCGVIDARHSLMEEPDRIVSFARELEEKVSPPSIALCPNCDLEFLPYPLAERKLQVLKESLRRSRAE